MSLVTGRRRLVGGAGFEKMGVATLNMIFSVSPILIVLLVTSL